MRASSLRIDLPFLDVKATLSPAERLKRRHAATELANRLVDELRARFPDLPLDVELEIIRPFGDVQPVDDEDGSILVRTNGDAVLRVQAAANDLARGVLEREGYELVPRVWPRTIWCRKSSRTLPPEQRAAAQSAGRPVVHSERDARGNTRLCLVDSHPGEHDFAD
jgi:hypothetical protein